MTMTSVRGPLAAVLMLAFPAAALGEEWRGYSYTSATQPGFEALVELGEAFGQATEGAVTFKWNVGGSLPIPAASITQAVGDGLVDIAADGFYTSSIPVGGIAFLPMLVSEQEDFDTLYATLEPYLAQAYERVGVKLLGHYNYPLQTAFANVEVTKLEDLNGKRIRVTSAEQAEITKLLGGSPVTIGTPEVPTSLQRGVINVVFSASAGAMQTYNEMITHNYRFGPNFHLSLIVANLEKFNALSEDRQQKLIEAARAAGANATARYAELEGQRMQEYEQRGMVITLPSDEEVGRATDLIRDYWGQWAANHGGEIEQAVRDVRAALDR